MAHRMRSFEWREGRLITNDYDFPSREYALSFYHRNRGDFFHNHKIKIYDEDGVVVHSSDTEGDTYA